MFGFATAVNLRLLGFPKQLSLLGQFVGEKDFILLCTFQIEYHDVLMGDSRIPILITSLGRSGSTLLTGLLACHPSVAVPQVLPFEERIAAYFADYFRSVSGYGSPTSGISRYPGKNHRSFPSNELLKSATLSRIEESARSNCTKSLLQMCGAHAIDLIDLHYSSFTSTDLAATPFFSEKMIGAFHTQEILYTLYDSLVEFILIRDPRDSLASAMAFNRKRNFAAFGAESAKSEIEWVANYANDARAILEASRQRPNAFMVRYERLVREPIEYLSVILHRCGLAHSPEVSRACVQQFEKIDLTHHRTSPSADLSISRWQADLPAYLIDVANNEFKDVLTAFGYE